MDVSNKVKQIQKALKKPDQMARFAFSNLAK
ncbi:hypothetical protein SAMN05216510_2041 [Pseudomonas coleopterorum]|nr:hypothetical protein SAMN05216510_2041 [Pseudomonas coleopterorum]